MNANSMKMTSYLFLGALAVLYVSFINEALSATAPNLRCQTPNEEKTFTVSEHKVTFHHENAFDRNRAISSEVIHKKPILALQRCFIYKVQNIKSI